LTSPLQSARGRSAAGAVDEVRDKRLEKIFGDAERLKVAVKYDVVSVSDDDHLRSGVANVGETRHLRQGIVNAGDVDNQQRGPRRSVERLYGRFDPAMLNPGIDHASVGKAAPYHAFGVGILDEGHGRGRGLGGGWAFRGGCGDLHHCPPVVPGGRIIGPGALFSLNGLIWPCS
jgi:hypothetical protein